MPKAAIAPWTLLMELDTFVPLTCENFRNCPDSSSSSFPVTPNKELTSPIAAPAVAKSVGIDVVISLRTPSISSMASPEAPVFWMMVSSPSSTDFQEDTAAAPMAVSGPVTPLVSAVPALVIDFPRDSDILVPAVLPAAEPAGPAAFVKSFVIFS